MASFLKSKFRFIAYIVIGFVLIIISTLFAGATLPLLINDLTYQGQRGYEAGGVIGMQLGLIGMVLTVLIIEVFRTKSDSN